MKKKTNLKRLRAITTLWNKWGMSTDKKEQEKIMIEINKIRRANYGNTRE